jgi:hypothetical protein
MVLDDSESSEPILGVLPDVFGLAERDGVALLELAGMTTTTVVSCSGSVEAGEVRLVSIDGEPIIDRDESRAGEAAFWNVGDLARVLLGNGVPCTTTVPAETTAPDLRGLMEAVAEASVLEIGLQPSFDYRSSDVIGPTEEGRVVSQQPEPGTRMAPGDALRMAIHAGPISPIEESVGKSGSITVAIAGEAAVDFAEDGSMSGRGVEVVEALLVKIYDVPIVVQWLTTTANSAVIMLASGEADMAIGSLNGGTPSEMYDEETGAAVWTYGDPDWTALLNNNVRRLLAES